MSAPGQRIRIRISVDNRECWGDVIDAGRRLMRCVPRETHQRGIQENNQKMLFHHGDSTPPPSPSPSPVSVHSTGTFPNFLRLPGELRREIWLLTVPEIEITAEYLAPEWYDRDRDWAGEFLLRTDRRWSDIALYSICRDSREVALASFGIPSKHTIPFNPLGDSVRLEGDLPNHWLYDPSNPNSDPAFTRICVPCRNGINSVNQRDGARASRVTVVYTTDKDLPGMDFVPVMLPYVEEGSEPQIIKHHLPKSFLSRFRHLTISLERNATFASRNDTTSKSLNDCFIRAPQARVSAAMPNSVCRVPGAADAVYRDAAA